MSALAQDLNWCVCEVEFNLPHNQWPFPGSPAWLVVMDSDMGLVKLRSRNSHDAKWVSASLIKSIKSTGQRESQ